MSRRARVMIAAAMAVGALLVLPGAASALEQKLVASDGAEQDSFGRSVDVDGDTAVVGAPADDGKKGALYVFTRIGDSWAQTAKLTASDGVGGDFLGESVAIDGDTIVAGAFADDNVKGAVYTFASTGAAARTETAKLTISNGARGDFLGDSVAIDGATIVASTPVASFSRGGVYTFARTGAAARTETAKLTASDGAGGDFLGDSVAIDGDTIVASADYDDVGANTDQGSVYTFATTGAAARTETAKLTASDGAKSDYLGGSVAIDGQAVAIDGDTIVAGASSDDIGANADQGSAYTFARTGAAARTETAKLTASDGARSDFLGSSVAIAGDTIVAGAPSDVVGGVEQGSAYKFARTGAARTETARLTASNGAADDQLGTSVAIDGDTTLAGARGANGGQGSASIFVPGPPSSLTVSKVGNGSGTVTSSPAGIDCGADCTEDYDDGARVTLTANPAAGSTFTGFTGGECTGAATTCTVTMDQAKIVTANFILKRALTVTKAGNGSGSVTSDPFGIDCGVDCDQDYDDGTKVTLTANPAAGSTFTGFTGGGCTGAAATCTVTMDQAKNVTATFVLTPRALIVSRAGEGSGTVASDPAGIDCGADCDQDYDDGTKVTLTANPAAGSTFTGFTGDDACTGAAATCTVTMDQARSVTATFAKKPSTPAPAPAAPTGDRLTLPAGNSSRVRATGRTASGGLVIVGTDGDDTIVGTGKGDRITGRGGRDTIRGGGGSDSISGGSGSDRISGGSGRDSITGGSGSDRLSGDSGNDRVNGGSGNDRLAGGPGNDRLSGNSGKDRLAGNSGNDSISGGSGRDRLSGGSGKNKLKQ